AQATPIKWPIGLQPAFTFAPASKLMIMISTAAILEMQRAKRAKGQRMTMINNRVGSICHLGTAPDPAITQFPILCRHQGPVFVETADLAKTFCPQGEVASRKKMRAALTRIVVLVNDI